MNSLSIKTSSLPGLSQLFMAVALTLISMLVLADPPTRVARLSVLSGDISLASADDDRWREADLNRPLVAGDRLYADSDARTELDLGTAVLRLDGKSEISLLRLDESIAQVELPEGTLNLTVRKLYDDQSYEIDTPTLALVIREPGAYRIDARRGATQVTVFDGSADVYGDNNAQQRVSARQSYRFPSASLRDYEVFDVPHADAFDDWCFARDERYQNPVARRYVSDDMVGYADLDDYGDWHEEPSYGTVWYPRRVVSGWAPYRDGHWAWIQPWGWTWIDNAPWGFAPSHYGRWIYVHNRWGWVPGPRTVRPVYAPALVAFIGGNNWSVGFFQSSSPVGWYPLGPQDIYEPPYQVSRAYFQKVNITNIHHTTVINQTTINNVYNDYANGRPSNHKRHTHRQNLKAVTVVERDTFVNAKPVARAQRKLKAEDLQRAEVVVKPDARPQQKQHPKAEQRQPLRSAPKPPPRNEVKSSRPEIPTTVKLSSHERSPRSEPLELQREQKSRNTEKKQTGKSSTPVRGTEASRLPVASTQRAPSQTSTNRKQEERAEREKHSARSSTASQNTRTPLTQPAVRPETRRDRAEPVTPSVRYEAERKPAQTSRSEQHDSRRVQTEPQRKPAPTLRREAERETVAPQQKAAEQPKARTQNKPENNIVAASDESGQKTKNPRSNKRGSDEKTRQHDSD